MPTTPVLSLRGISKRFGAVQALSHVDLDVHAGEVVALVGDNGAGKSTLVKVIAGVGPADEGTIAFQGESVAVASPLDAQALGIATVHQDLALCDNLDVVANLFLGREIRRFGFVLDEVAMERRARDLLDTLSVKIPSVRVPVAALSGGQRQTVAIARSLLGEPRLVILDEPTAALGVEQTAQVLDLIDQLRARGLGVLLISHNMADVLAVADRVAVLRLGRNNGEFPVAGTSEEQIVSAITGASDNAVTRRRERIQERRTRTADPTHPAEAPGTAAPAAPADPGNPADTGDPADTSDPADTVGGGAGDGGAEGRGAGRGGAGGGGGDAPAAGSGAEQKGGVPR